MREFKYGVGVIAPNFLLNLLLVKMSKKSSTKADFQGKNQKDMSDDGSNYTLNSLIKVLVLWKKTYQNLLPSSLFLAVL